MKKLIYILLSFLICTNITACSSQKSNKPNTAYQLGKEEAKTTANTKKELIKSVIEIAIVSREIPDFELIKDKNDIIISSNNIEQSLLPKIPNIRFTILSPDEIIEKANKEGDFLYLEFKEIKINKDNASISIDNVWAVSYNSQIGYLSGGGLKIKFHKISGKWIEDKFREVWQS